MRQFNEFIDSANIMEIPFQNGKFTWSKRVAQLQDLCWTYLLSIINGMMNSKTQECPLKQELSPITSHYY